MPNLVLSNIRIMKLSKQKARLNPDKPYYVVAEAAEQDNFFAEPITVSLLESNYGKLVTGLRRYFPKGEKYNGTNDALAEESFDAYEAEEKIPMQLRELPESMIVRQYLGGPYLMKYNQDILDESGNPIPNKKQGDWVRSKDGRIKVYTHKDFAVCYQYQWVKKFINGKMEQIPLCDSDGNPIMTPASGWDPEQQAKDYRERFCYPLSELEKSLCNELPDEYRPGSTAGVMPKKQSVEAPSVEAPM